MAKMAKMRDKGQITVPSDVREAAHLEEGDPVEFEVTEDGILMRPKKVIDPTQAWFWTPEWQAKERGADEDVRGGRMTRAMSTEAFLAMLAETSDQD